MDGRGAVSGSTICWSIVTWAWGMDILSTAQVCITRFATILDANTIPGLYAKINELLLSNLIDRQLQHAWCNPHPPLRKHGEARLNGPCAVGPKDVFCLASGAKSSKAEPLHLEDIQIGGICTSGGSWMSARRKKAAAG